MKKCLILGLFVWDAFIISDGCEESLKLIRESCKKSKNQR